MRPLWAILGSLAIAAAIMAVGLAVIYAVLILIVR